MKYESSYLSHHGIKGQQWGVRRFQNEDGTLTEEGRRRYLKGYDQVEKKADEDIKRAESQIADIEKNGWNAKSAFSKQFVKQLKAENMLDDENLEFYKSFFEQDIKDAKASKKAAQEARSLIEKNKNITYDQILDWEKKKYNEDERLKFSNFEKESKNAAKEMNLIQKKKDTLKVSVPEYDKKTRKEFLETQYHNDMQELRKMNQWCENIFDQLGLKDQLKAYVSKKSEDEQNWIYLNMLDQLGILEAMQKQ